MSIRKDKAILLVKTRELLDSIRVTERKDEIELDLIYDKLGLSLRQLIGLVRSNATALGGEYLPTTYRPADKNAANWRLRAAAWIPARFRFNKQE